jgi:hypothetical protein
LIKNLEKSGLLIQFTPGTQFMTVMSWITVDLLNNQKFTAVAVVVQLTNGVLKAYEL